VKRRAAVVRHRRIGNGDEFRWLGLGVAVYVGLALTGLWIAWSSQSVRALHVEMQVAQREQDALLEQYSRLLIERSMLGSYQNVDEVAERRLSMNFPEAVERVAP